jgi:hypothetical protein
VVENLPNTCETMSSNPSTTKKKKKRLVQALKKWLITKTLLDPP